jgi:flagellar biosynthesis/type III secretory pathway protein FliH
MESMFDSLKMASEAMNRMTETETERMRYESRLIYQLDQKQYVKDAKEEGFSLGVIEGKVLGKNEGKVEGKVEEAQKLFSSLLQRRYGRSANPYLQSAANLHDLETIENLTYLVVDCSTIEDFANASKQYGFGQ